MKVRWLVVVLLFWSLSFAQLEYPGTVDILGSEETLFNSATDSCSRLNIPDGPARVFRDASGTINMLISHYVAYRLIGPDFNSLTIDCANGPIFSSHYDSDPSQYNDHEWLGGLYTPDGRTVYALVHNEYQGWLYDSTYSGSDWIGYWYNAVTLATSNDSGKTFTHAPAPSHLVASIPYQYAGGQGPMGVFEPSNIIYNSNDGYYYALVKFEEYGAQPVGVSVIRTRDLSDPTSWRGWDGSDFTVRFVNPYTESGFDPAEHVCQPVDYDNIEKMHSSITWNTYFQKFLLIGLAQKNKKWGIYYSLSSDLIHWTVRKLVMEANVNINPDADPTQSLVGYPSIIDHNDTTRNFEQTGREVYLYYTTWFKDNPYDRKLVRIPIRFNKLIVDTFVVNSVGDRPDVNPGDGIAATNVGKSSLRAVINEVNARPFWYRDSIIPIAFNVDRTAPFTINLYSYLPAIQYPVVIDGFTQPGASPNSNRFSLGSNAQPWVIIDANQNGGLEINGGHTTVRGLVIIDQVGPAITINDSGYCIIAGNYLGVDETGSEYASPDAYGVRIMNAANNIIGGENPADRNLIGGGITILGSGASGNRVQGNYLGTDASGTIAFHSNGGGIDLGNGATGNLIGGDSPEARTLISGNNYHGVVIHGEGTDSNRVVNNLIGVDITGEKPLGNGGAGIYFYHLASENLIYSNIVSANEDQGIWIENSPHNTIQGNFVGSDSTGQVNMGNVGSGVFVGAGCDGTTIGGHDPSEANTIAFNNVAGVAVRSDAGYGIRILGNAIYRNRELGIDLNADNMVNENDLLDGDDGANGLQNFPEIQAVTPGDSLTVQGSLNSLPNQSYEIQFFASDTCDPSGFGEGQQYLGSLTVNTDANGNADFRVVLAADSIQIGDFITATATDADGNTSEFSQAIAVERLAAYIRVTPGYLQLSAEQNDNDQTTLLIYNDGNIDLNWKISWQSSWLSLTPDSGQTEAGGQDSCTVQATASNLTPGTYQDTLRIQSNDPDSSLILVPVSFVVSEPTPQPRIEVEPSIMHFYMSPNQKASLPLILRNNGDADLTWTVGWDYRSSWLGSDPGSGTTPPGGSSQVQISVNSQGMDSSLYEGTLIITSNDPDAAEVLVPVYVHIDTVQTKLLDSSLPNRFRLLPNYPNPFNPRTTIRYQLPQQAEVDLSIFNTRGQRIATLVRGKQAPGTYEIAFEAENLASGVYFIRLKAGNFLQIRKMILSR